MINALVYTLGFFALCCAWVIVPVAMGIFFGAAWAGFVLMFFFTIFIVCWSLEA